MEEEDGVDGVETLIREVELCCVALDAIDAREFVELLARVTRVGRAEIHAGDLRLRETSRDGPRRRARARAEFEKMKPGAVVRSPGPL